jgi:predicted peroxiredoxin
MPFPTHWQIGGAFIIAFLAAVVGLAVYITWRIRGPAFFKGKTLTRATPALVPEPGAEPD